MDTVEMQKLQTAIAEKAKTDKKALAELIVEYIDPKHTTLDIVGMFLNTRSLKPGDALVKKVRRGIKVFQLVPGQTTLSSQVTLKEYVNHNLDSCYVQCSQNVWELEAGEVGTIQSIRTEMVNKLADYFVGKVLTALYTMASTNDATNFYVLSDLTRSAIEGAIDYVNDVADGGTKAVVGRRTALSPITKWAGYRAAYGATESSAPIVGIQSTLENIQSAGWFGSYYGVNNWVVLNQIYDNPYDRNKLIKDDLIVVIGNKCGEFITYGNPREDEWTEPSTAPPTWNLRIMQQFGLLFDAMENVVILRTDG